MSPHDTKERTIDQERRSFRRVRKLCRGHVRRRIDPRRGPFKNVSGRTDRDLELTAGMPGTVGRYRVDN